MMKFNVSDYISRITSEHSGRLKFIATITESCNPIVEISNGILTIPDSCDLDIAQGDQLDLLGEWIGISRNLSIPLTGVGFSFDNRELGFDAGAWLSIYEESVGLTALPDEQYRLLLRIKILNNHWDGSTQMANTILGKLFTGSMYLPFVQDNCDMTMSICLAGYGTDSIVRQMLLNGLLDIKPIGVGSKYLIASKPGSIFGFDVDNLYISGFDTGSWATLLSTPQSSGSRLNIDFILNLSQLV